MSYNDHIASGILLDYCLGMLNDEDKTKVEELSKKHPEIKQEITLIQQGMENHALKESKKPRAALKGAIWNTINELDKEAEMSLTNLPIVNKHSDIKKWLSIVRPLLPEKLEGDEFSVMLQDTDKVMQKVLMSKRHHPDEVHDVVLENLLILEGECICRIDGKYYQFRAGDLIDIPLNIVHDLRVTSPHIILIVQHLAA